jgi:hypothetical protein
MATEDRARRVDVGFAGGQVLALRLRESVYKDLQKALSSDKNSGWHELKTEDSDVTVDLAQVVYVRIDTEEHKVGF